MLRKLGKTKKFANLGVNNDLYTFKWAIFGEHVVDLRLGGVDTETEDSQAATRLWIVPRADVPASKRHWTIRIRQITTIVLIPSSRMRPRATVRSARLVPLGRTGTAAGAVPAFAVSISLLVPSFAFLTSSVTTIRHVTRPASTRTPAVQIAREWGALACVSISAPPLLNLLFSPQLLHITF